MVFPRKKRKLVVAGFWGNEGKIGGDQWIFKAVTIFSIISSILVTIYAYVKTHRTLQHRAL